jgi:hypothetical protein
MGFVVLAGFCWGFYFGGGGVEIESLYVAQTGLGLTILLPKSSKHWDYTHITVLC